MYKLTKTGKRHITAFIAECEAKRKEILDAEKDTAEETTLPTERDVLDDINFGVGVDSDGDYYNCWGVTDNYDSEQCTLQLGIDFR